VVEDKMEEIIQPKSIICKNCNSNAVVKFGSYKGVQRYYCKVCHRKFKSDDTLFHMKTPTNQISSTLNMWYEGMSQNAIRRHLKQENQNMPSSATIYEWIDKYSQSAIKHTREYHPKVGDIWVADETVLRINGQNVWFWDVIDRDTRFLLASRVSTSRTNQDAQILMNKATSKAGKNPKLVITDKLASYLDIAYGKDTEHRQGSPFKTTSEDSTRDIERFHGTLKARTKVMRGLKNLESAIQFTEGWLVHYNYLRPHEGLHDKTPAEVAGIDFPYKNWVDITRIPVPDYIRPASPRYKFKIPKTHIGRPRKRTRNTILGKIHRARQGGGLTRRVDR
jgi:putative transposase